MIIGYARVSTDDQSLNSQTDALSAAGAEKVFADRISGSKRTRPELDRMLEQLRDGDVGPRGSKLHIWAFERTNGVRFMCLNSAGTSRHCQQGT